MRKFWIIALMLIGQQCFAQGASPVKWHFSVKKLREWVYEWKANATIGNPWHIYSQSSPDGGPIPTTISFNKNPLIQPEGRTVKEFPKMNTKHEEVFDIDVKYDEGSVEFVQVFKLKQKVKTNICGVIEFMICNESECLPPASQNFSIAIE
ncbi:hypothetical protein [Sediminibacterium sp.]|uniref:hypothetical protein n=1 Tax=Sediminibacterium sp. TaxID=1917865 RepID=UPI003F69C5DE